MSLAVLTAFIVIPTQSVTIDKFSQFHRERAYAMVLLLIGDVPRDATYIRLRH
jgi:hypothetical protein